MGRRRGDNETVMSVDRSRAERATFDWRNGYIKVMDLSSHVKKYHAILWRGPKMQASKQSFPTATEAARYGHQTRKRSRLLRRLYEKDEDEAPSEK